MGMDIVLTGFVFGVGRGETKDPRVTDGQTDRHKTPRTCKNRNKKQSLLVLIELAKKAVLRLHK